MNKVLKFLLSIVSTFSITSCGLLNGLNEEEESSEGGGFDFGDSGFGTNEDTTPASDNTPSSETPSEENPSSGGESQGETTETKYRINFYNGVNHLGYLDLKGGTKVTVETYTPIPTYPNPSSGFDYTFVGWSETRQNNDLGSATTYTVSKNTNLYAVYSRKLKQYSVNFKYGTTDLGSKDFAHGSVVETNNKYGYDNKLTKTESGKTYTFIGWNETRQDNDVGEAKSYTVNRNLTLFAVFSSETQKYSVTFKKDGADLGSKDFVYGSKIYKTDTFGYNVSKTSTAQYSYTFDGWNETSTASSGVEYTVTRNMTVHAIYTSTTRQYSVTFKNGNTTLKGPTSVNYGVKPTAPSNPSKSETGVTYTFVGWSEDQYATSTSSNVFTSDKLPTVSKDTVYYAIFSSSTKTYQITFKNGNTTLKGPTAVNHGVMPTAPTNPTKTEEKNDSTGIKYTYTFAGWSTTSNASAGSNNVYASNNIPVATKDDTYYAIFSKTTYYLVTFYNGTTALTSDYYVKSGDKPTYSGTPSKQGNGVTYTFIGWNESSTATTGTLTANLPTVSKKTNYYAVFSSTTKTYQITFKNGNTTLKGPTAVNHGVMPTAPTNPTKNEEKNNSTGIKYTYTFAGWSTSSTASAGSSNVYASNNIPVATKDDTYYAIFSKTTYYLVTFYNGTTALTSDYYVKSGDKPTYSGTPSKQGNGVTYTFIGWNESSTATSGTKTGNLPTVSKKTNYYAVFSSATTTYQVTFMNGSNIVAGPMTVNHGDRPSIPSNPTKNPQTYSNEGKQIRYTFLGWSIYSDALEMGVAVFTSSNFPTVESNKTYYAIFSEEIYFLVTFYNGSTKLKEDYIKEGSKPLYDGTEPSLSGKTFVGWSDDSKTTPDSPDLYKSYNLPIVWKKTEYFAIFADNSSIEEDDEELDLDITELVSFDVNWSDYGSGVRVIGFIYFNYYSEIKKIKIPSTVIFEGKEMDVREIQNHCFAYSSLESVTLPNTITRIGAYSFAGSSALTTINIPNSVTLIGESAFSGCASLKTVTLSDKMTDIYQYSFNNCVSLDTVTIPASITRFENYAFQNCTKLTTITYQGTTSQWNSISKYPLWKQGSSIKTINCSNGTINI